MPSHPLRFLALALVPLLLAGFLVAPAAAEEDPDAQRAALLERLAEIGENPEGLAAADRLQQLIDLYFEWAMNEFPEFATYIGHPAGQDRWTDSSLAAIERREAAARQGVAVLRTIPREELEGEDRLNYDLLADTLEDQVAGQRFPGELLAISQMGGVQQNVPDLLAQMPVATVAQVQNVLARLRGVPKLIDDDLVLLEKGREGGVTPPRVTLRDLPQQVANLIPEEPLESALLAPFDRLGEGIPEGERQRLREEAVALYREELVPAYRRLHDYLVATYLPGARESIAMTDLPDGDAWYAHQVAQMTTTDLTPAEIHAIGQREVARIRAEMERVKEEAGFDGTLDEFFTFLRTDPQFFFTSEEELLATYRDIAKRADPELVKLFGTLPRLPYGVIAVPDYAEKSQTTAYYQPGTIEAGRPGYFFANTYDLPSRPKWEMEALTLHEAVPGHHLQISLAQEIDDLPWFRRFGGETAFVEGWGLYAESLGTEMGFYRDPYSRFGQLTYEMWRAIRLVVDTGMHSLGWSREQAIEFFRANAGKAEHDIVVEVDRYIVWPGQALAYKIGELEIKKLRAWAKDELGETFDVRAFHDTVLGAGALPLDVLARRVEEWVASEKSPPPASVAEPG